MDEKPIYKCKLLRFSRRGALIIREDDHTVLGPPKDGKATITSIVKHHDEVLGLIETKNSIYVYGEHTKGLIG